MFNNERIKIIEENLVSNRSKINELEKDIKTLKQKTCKHIWEYRKQYNDRNIPYYHYLGSSYQSGMLFIKSCCLCNKEELINEEQWKKEKVNKLKEQIKELNA